MPLVYPPLSPIPPLVIQFLGTFLMQGLEYSPVSGASQYFLGLNMQYIIVSTYFGRNVNGAKGMAITVGKLTLIRYWR